MDEVRDPAASVSDDLAWVSQAVEMWIARFEPRLVAVDAPCGRGAKPSGKSARTCEQAAVRDVNELWARGRLDSSVAAVTFGIAPTPHRDRPQPYGWMHTGFAVYGALASSGYERADSLDTLSATDRVAVEVYPDATFWLLGSVGGWGSAVERGAPVARKRHARKAQVVADRLAVLPDALRVALAPSTAFPPTPSRQPDFVDAVAGALTGEMALRHRARSFDGLAGEGSLWLPEVTVGAGR